MNPQDRAKTASDTKSVERLHSQNWLPPMNRSKVSEVKYARKPRSMTGMPASSSNRR